MRSKVLNTPFFPQTDNIFNPNGACNVTSIAMCLSFLGIVGDGSSPQLEDQLYQLCLSKSWSRHSPIDLVKVVRFKGKKDTFITNGTIEQIKKHIDRGFPCVIHGYFTRSGHIIEVHGYDEKGLICHDPYGSYQDGYSSKVSNGKNINYSYDLIKRVCMPDGDLWLHRIEN
jgi:uncharacterized protein YvpB